MYLYWYIKSNTGVVLVVAVFFVIVVSLHRIPVLDKNLTFSRTVNLEIFTWG